MAKIYAAPEHTTENTLNNVLSELNISIDLTKKFSVKNFILKYIDYSDIKPFIFALADEQITGKLSKKENAELTKLFRKLNNNTKVTQKTADRFNELFDHASKDERIVIAQKFFTAKKADKDWVYSICRLNHNIKPKLLQATIINITDTEKQAEEKTKISFSY